MRPSKRVPNELRPLCFTRRYTMHAAGSVLVESGDTKVICTASIEENVPRFLRDAKQGWITAEYGMLPGSTNSRCAREAMRGKQSGRTVEIQRLIGRSLRAVVDLKALGERTITLDCDVIQADGGTRSAAINGSCLALVDAIQTLRIKGKLKGNDPLKRLVAAVSVGVYQGTPVVDLDYAEDSAADMDMNVVMTEEGDFIEVQGTAEGSPFPRQQLDELLQLASHSIEQIIAQQKAALEEG